jgi:HSP20 family protein
MTLIRRPSPFGEMLSLRSAMDRIFDEAFVRPLAAAGDDARGMPLDIYTTPDALVIEAALPGVRPEDVDISVLGDTLTLTATSAAERSEESADYLYREVRRGRTSRTVTLPAGLRTSDAEATFEHGMLRLTFPKAEQARPRQIRISPSSEGTATTVSHGRSPEAAGTSAPSSDGA